MVFVYVRYETAKTFFGVIERVCVEKFNYL